MVLPPCTKLIASVGIRLNRGWERFNAPQITEQPILGVYDIEICYSVMVAHLLLFETIGADRAMGPEGSSDLAKCVVMLVFVNI